MPMIGNVVFDGQARLALQGRPCSLARCSIDARSNGAAM